MPNGLAGGAMAGGLAVALSAKDQASAVFAKVGKSSTAMAGTIVVAMAKINWSMLIAGAAMVAMTAISIKAAVSFQEEVTKAMMMFGDITEEQFVRSSEAARASALEFGVSANETAKVLWFLGSAGMDVASSLKMLNDVVRFSRVNFVGTAEATDTVVTAMKIFGLEASDVKSITDTLTEAQRASLVTMGEMQESFKFVAPVAARAGMNLSETAAVTAALADAGIRGSMGGTVLRRALINLMAPTTRVNKGLDVLGVSVYDAEGNLRHMFDVLDDIYVSMGKVTEQQALQSAQWIFGTRAIAGMLSMAKRGVTSIRELADQTAESTATTQMWNTYSQTAAVQLSILKESFVDAARGIGTVLLPPFMLLLSGIKWFIGLIGTVLGPFKDLIAYFIAFVGPLLILKALFPILIVLIKKMVYAMTVGLVRSLIGAVAALKTYIIAKWAAVTANLAFYTSTILMAAAVAAAIAAIYIITDNMNKQTAAQIEGIEATEAGVDALAGYTAELMDAEEMTSAFGGTMGDMVKRYESLREKVLDLQRPTEQQIILARELDLALWIESNALFELANAFKVARAEIKANEFELREYTRLMWALEDVSRTFSISEQGARLRVMEIERRARLEGRALRTEELYEIEELEYGLEELRYQQTRNQLEAAILRDSEAGVRIETQSLRWTIEDATATLESHIWALKPIPDVMKMIYDTGLLLSEWEKKNLAQTFNLSSTWSDFADTMTEVVIPAMDRVRLTGMSIIDVLKGMRAEIDMLPSAPTYVPPTVPKVTVPRRAIPEPLITGYEFLFPWLHQGGIAQETGLHYLKKGEEVRPPGTSGDVHIVFENVTIDSKADADYLLDQLERRLYYNKQYSQVR